MIGGNSERKKRISVRAGMFNIFAKNEYELDPNFAFISPIKDEHQAVIGYGQSIEYLTGFIEDIQLQKRTRKIGGVPQVNYYIDIYMDSGGTKLIIELNFDSGPGKSFAKTFRNLIPHLNGIVCIAVYQMKPEEGQKYGRQGTLLYPGSMAPIKEKGAHLPSFYISTQTPVHPQAIEGTHFAYIPSFQKQGRDGMEYDSDAASNWIYAAFREDIYYVYNHYELAEEAPPTFGQAPVQNQQAYAAAPPPQANNFYANAPQTQQQYTPAAQPPQPQHYANTGHAPNPGPPTPPAPQQSFGPPPPNNMPPRPQRTEPVQTYAAPNNQPIHQAIAPDLPPPPAREYVQREPLPAAPPQNNGAYNANAGMATNRPPVANAFDDLAELGDDLPF
jgi:hypothetical protein